MATLTEKLGLIKPEIDDMITPTIFADNFDKIETELYKIADCMTFDNENSMLQLRSGGETGTILSELEIRTGDVSVLLPPNPVVNVGVDNFKITLTWTRPESEIEIKEYKIYTSTTKPTFLSDMTFRESTTELTYVIEGLSNHQTYYFAVQSVGVNEYENASILKVKTGEVNVPPNNPVVTVDVAPNKIILNWTKPNGNVNANKYKVYISTTQPTSLSDMTYKGATANLTYSLTGLSNGQTYYVSVQSVDASGCENMDISNINNCTPNFRFVCVGWGDNPSGYSTDGVTWKTMKGLPNGRNDRYHSVAYGNGRFVCVGRSGSYYSTDGLTWTAMSGFNNEYGLRGAVSYGNGKFVMIVNGSAYYSTGSNWIKAADGIDILNIENMIYANGRFVCIGTRSVYSTDGLTWTTMSGMDESTQYYGITYGNGRFVCVGSDGKSHYSTNGTSWTAMSGLDSSKSYTAVLYCNNRFVCYADSSTGTDNLYYSTNGTSWTKNNSSVPSWNYTGATYGNGKFIFTSIYGALLHSTDGISWNYTTMIDPIAEASVSGESVCFEN